MSILIVIHSLACGGAERVAAGLANYWARNGRAVTVVTLQSRETDFYTLAQGVSRAALGVAGTSSSIVGAVANNAARIRALRRAIRDVNPDVVVAHMTTTNVLAILASAGLGCPVVATEQIHPPQAPVGKIFDRARRFTYGFADAVAVLTAKTAAWVRTNTLARRVSIIPNAVTWPLPSLEPRTPPETVCRPGRPALLAVGRLAPQKGFDLLLEAFALVATRHRQWDLVVVGEGPERPELAAQAEALGLADRILMPGIAGNVADWYERASVYVMSSRFEGFPNTLLEAMASGLPVVSFDCDTGPADIIRHGVDGLLVPPGDVDALAAALARLMDDEDLRLRLGKRAVEVRERFSEARIMALWDNLFREIGLDPS